MYKSPVVSTSFSVSGVYGFHLFIFFLVNFFPSSFVDLDWSPAKDYIFSARIEKKTDASLRMMLRFIHHPQLLTGDENNWIHSTLGHPKTADFPSGYATVKQSGGYAPPKKKSKTFFFPSTSLDMYK